MTRKNHYERGRPLDEPGRSPRRSNRELGTRRGDAGREALRPRACSNSAERRSVDRSGGEAASRSRACRGLSGPLNRLSEHYRYKYQKHTWPWPANWISYNTSVSKPAATDFQEYLESKIATQRSEWQREVQALRIRLRSTRC